MDDQVQPMDSPSLIALLPKSAYLFAYALPLLFLSLIVTFAGTFLTLDRSRSFPSRSSSGYASVQAPGGLSLATQPRKFAWYLEGGIGGLAGGYLFGLHFASALALLIPATTHSSPIFPGAFLAVWVITSVLTTVLGGRYRLAALAFYATSGGTLGSLALAVIIHPSLSSRVVLTSIFLPLFIILVLVCSIIPRVSFVMLRPVLRICSSATGSFGLVVSIALLLKPQVDAWANVWERLWLKDGMTWGSSKEKGLSAAFGLFMAAGIAADWALKRWIGECPDEKWDNYLAHYTTSLPNQADRAGTFQPLVSFWDRIFPSTREVPFPHIKPNLSSKEIIFPDDVDGKKPSLPLPVTMMRNVAPPGGGLARLPTKQDRLRKPRGRGRKSDSWAERFRMSIGREGREPVKFGPLDELSSDSSDEDGDVDLKEKEKSREKLSDPPTGRSPSLSTEPKHIRGSDDPLLTPYSGSNTSSSAPTLVDGQRPHRSRPSLSQSHSQPSPVSHAHPHQLDYDLEIRRLREERGKDYFSGEYSDYDSEADQRGSITRRPPRRYTGPPSPPNRVRGPRRMSSGLSTVKDSDDHTTVGEVSGDGEMWSPGFLRQPSIPQPRGHQHQASVSFGEGLNVKPVPATPSLINALDRVRQAQEEAYGVPPANGRAGGSSGSGSPKGGVVNIPLPMVQERDVTEGGEPMSLEPDDRTKQKQKEKPPRWDDFWKEVRVKAQS